VNEFEQGETEVKRLWHQTIDFSTQTVEHSSEFPFYPQTSDFQAIVLLPSGNDPNCDLYAAVSASIIMNVLGP